MIWVTRTPRQRPAPNLSAFKWLVGCWLVLQPVDGQKIRLTSWHCQKIPINLRRVLWTSQVEVSRISEPLTGSSVNNQLKVPFSNTQGHFIDFHEDSSGLIGGWTNTLENICSILMGSSSPKDRGESVKKCEWKHHLVEWHIRNTNWIQKPG